jgi:hypothetical protein
LREYRALITEWFDEEEFRTNPSIKVRTGTRALSDFLHFYNPWWYSRDGRPIGKFEEVLADDSARATTVAEEAGRPDKWDNSSAPLALDQIRPVPIATDTSIGKTLILDSNRTICRLIFRDKSPLDQKITVVEVIGPDLQSLNGDLKALRQRS